LRPELPWRGEKSDNSWRYFRKFDSEISFQSAVKKHKASATSVMIRQAAKICRKAPPFLHHICCLVCPCKTTADLRKSVGMISPNFVKTFKYWLKSKDNKLNFTRSSTCVYASNFSVFRWIFIGMKKDSNESGRKVNIYYILWPFSGKSYEFKVTWTKVVPFLCLYSHRICLFYAVWGMAISVGIQYM